MKPEQCLALPALVIFDWDDTLVDSYAAIHAAINAARAAFALPIWTLEETRENCRIALKEIFPVWFGAEWEKAQDIFYATFAAQHIALLKSKSGAEAVLNFFAARNIPMAVNSNKKSQYLHEEIVHLGWGDFFKVIIGAGDVALGKPAPDGISAIRAACRIESDSPDAVWFVGDNVVDAKTARAGGVIAVIVNADYAGLHGEVVFGDLKSLLVYSCACA